MKLGIDARFLQTRSRGPERYIEKLIENLTGIIENHEVYLFVLPHVKLSGLPKNWRVIKVKSKWYGLSEQLIFPFQLYKYHLDLVHFCHFNAPIIYRKKYIVTIHDLIMYKYQGTNVSTRNPILFVIKYRIFKLVMLNAVHKSKKIISVSNYTKNDILKHFKIKSEKISVIYNGTAIEKKNGTDIPNDSKGGNNDKYFLYIGSAYPHKNLRFLIRTFSKWQRSNPDYKLILAGGDDPFYTDLKKYADKSDGASIQFKGHVSNEELIKLYKNAHGFVFPSLFEGFGVPPLEAMQLGIPVISSNLTCLPEILGRAAYYINPRDERELSQGFTAIAGNDELRRKLISAGFAQARIYSWQKAARSTYNLYLSIQS